MVTLSLILTRPIPQTLKSHTSAFKDSHSFRRWFSSLALNQSELRGLKNGLMALPLELLVQWA